jgi:NAD(P)-dependent dehydrogenase (short-subunit alcohol dehydrogenase family)
MVQNTASHPSFLTDPAELKGKRALVTGGTRGIGAAIVRRLLDAGAVVIASARTPVPDLQAGATFFKADVSTLQGTRDLAEHALKELGGIDILVNNAGASRAYPGGSLTIEDSEWQDALDANYLSSVRLTAALLPGMIERKSGAIVNISSVAAITPMGPLLHYGAAKAALMSYTKGLATELAPHGIRVNLVTPGNVTSPGADAIRSTIGAAFGIDPAAMAASVPLGRNGVPTDISEIVGFLVSERAAWITGSELIIDGGQYPAI